MLLTIELVEDRLGSVDAIFELCEVMELTADKYNPGLASILVRGLNQARRKAQAEQGSRQNVNLQPEQIHQVAIQGKRETKAYDSSHPSLVIRKSLVPTAALAMSTSSLPPSSSNLLANAVTEAKLDRSTSLSSTFASPVSAFRP